MKRNNGVFIIPLFLLKNFRYSIIPAQKFSLFHYSCSKIFIIPLFLPKNHTLFHYSKNKISVILIPLFLFSPLGILSVRVYFRQRCVNVAFIVLVCLKIDKIHYNYYTTHAYSSLISLVSEQYTVSLIPQEQR